MKTIIIGFFSLVFTTTNVVAAVGENIGQLIGRYGEPENGFELMLDSAEWKTKQGGKESRYFGGWKAVIIVYRPDDSGAGGVDEGAKDALLERNLPEVSPPYAPRD